MKWLGAVVVWVALEYLFGVMMGVLRNSSDYAWPLIGHSVPILPSDWLIQAGLMPLMITTLMTFLRSLNNEGQEER